MNTRFCIFSDLHLHPWSYGSSIVRGRNSRLLFQQASVLEILSYADRNDIRDIVFCGDFFHSHSVISSEVIQATWEIFQEGWPYNRFFFLMGNHDMADKFRNITAIKMLSAWGKVITSPSFFGLTDNIGHVFIPYCETKEELEQFLALIPNDQDPYFLFMHQGIAGVPVNSTGFTINEVLTPDMIPTKALAAFAGHYHSHKQVSDKLWIPGSMNQLIWTDITEKRGWLDIEVDSNLNIKVTQIESASPKFMYKKDFDCLGDIKGNMVRIDCSSPSKVAEMKEEALKYNPLSLEVRIPSTEPEKIQTPKNFSTILDLFHEYLEGNNFTPDFVKIGKDIINKSI